MRGLTGPLVLGISVLVVGAAAMAGLIIFKRVPAEATTESQEKSIYVVTDTLRSEDVPVTIEGFGQVTAKRSVVISPEVSGRIMEVHPNLVVGGIVPAGEVLFAIDARPLAAHVADAAAQLARQESAVRRLHTEADHARTNLTRKRRDGELADQQFKRAKTLFDKGVGSQSAVEDAERMSVSVHYEIEQLVRELALYPLRIEEAESDVASAKARQEMAHLDLDRARISAPFTARVKECHIEKDEVVAVGTPALVLVDDSVLEISVSLNSRDARQWLAFEAREDTARWFGSPVPVTCTIQWTEDADGRTWEGLLHRVANYNEESRTLTVVIRVEGDRVLSDDQFPLVDGMFCAVTIPGRTMNGVFRLEPHMVSFENTVYVAEGDRLKTVAVEVVRIEEDFTYVSGGLKTGDQVIRTRLVNPLDHSLLSIADREEGENGDAESAL